MIIHQLNVFLFCEIYVSNSSFRMCIFRLLIKKFRIFFTQQCNTNDVEMNRSKHFSFSFYFFFSFHFIRNFIVRYSLYHIRLFQFVDYRTFFLFVFRSFRYQFFKLTFFSIKSNIVNRTFRLYDFKNFVNVS